MELVVHEFIIISTDDVTISSFANNGFDFSSFELRIDMIASIVLSSLEVNHHVSFKNTRFIINLDSMTFLDVSRGRLMSPHLN